jgi:hypothetical protein
MTSTKRLKFGVALLREKTGERHIYMLRFKVGGKKKDP